MTKIVISYIFFLSRLISSFHEKLVCVSCSVCIVMKPQGPPARLNILRKHCIKSQLEGFFLSHDWNLNGTFAELHLCRGAILQRWHSNFDCSAEVQFCRGATQILIAQQRCNSAEMPLKVWLLCRGAILQRCHSNFDCSAEVQLCRGATQILIAQQRCNSAEMPLKFWLLSRGAILQRCHSNFDCSAEVQFCRGATQILIALQRCNSAEMPLKFWLLCRGGLVLIS